MLAAAAAIVQLLGLLLLIAAGALVSPAVAIAVAGLGFLYVGRELDAADRERPGSEP